MDLYSQGYERSYTVNSSILNAIEPHLKDFQQLLLDPPKVKENRNAERRAEFSYEYLKKVNLNIVNTTLLNIYRTVLPFDRYDFG